MRILKTASALQLAEADPAGWALREACLARQVRLGSCLPWRTLSKNAISSAANRFVGLVLVSHSWYTFT